MQIHINGNIPRRIALPLFMVLTFLVGLGLLLLGLSGYGYATLYRDEGVITQATVTNKDHQRRCSTNSGGDTRCKDYYTLFYRYEVYEKQYDSSGSVSRELYHASPVGSVLDIAYLPNDPTAQRPVAMLDEDGQSALLVAVIGPIASWIFTISMALQLRKDLAGARAYKREQEFRASLRQDGGGGTS
jgi:hypothetical protein